MYQIFRSKNCLAHHCCNAHHQAELFDMQPLATFLRRSTAAIRTTRSPIAFARYGASTQALVPAVVAPFLGSSASLGGVRTKVSERSLRRKNLRKMKSQVEQVPLLKDTLRKLYMRTHPDLFGKYPEQQATNDASYKELMGILDSIENHNEFPPAKTLVLPFYLRTPVEGEFNQVALRMRTTGGACNTLVEEALGVFFTDCGLPGVFRWSEGSWGKAVGRDAAVNSNSEFDDEEDAIEKKRREEAEAEAKKAKEEQAKYSAPAYNPVDRTAPADNSIEHVLNELNDVFEIIAAVPWMDEEEYAELRKYYKEEEGLMEIEMRGFTIKEATEKIWEGERDLNVLARGVDADSAMIIQRILMHTFNIELKIREHLEKEGAEEDEEETDATKTN